VTAVALSVGQRSVGCSSVDAIWAAAAAADHNRMIASPLPNPQTGFVTSDEHGVDIN